MKPLDYFYTTAAEGPEHFPQRFTTFFFGLAKTLLIPLFRFKAYDAEKYRRSVSGQLQPRAWLIAGNHRSYLDPVFVMMALRPRPIRFMAKEEFFKPPVIGRLASWVGAFPIRRDAADMKALKRSVAMLKRGELVGIFPEGSRGRDLDSETPREAHEGVALISQLAKVEVVPVRIWGTAHIHPEGARFWRFPRITVRFGEPLSLEDEKYQALDKEVRFAAFTTDVMAAVYALENPRENKN